MEDTPVMRSRLAPHALRLSTPIMPASGCFGPELADVVDASVFGAVVTKTIFVQRRGGNPEPRVHDAGNGMLNAVGIPSPGSAHFIDSVLPSYRTMNSTVIVSLGGTGADDYAAMLQLLEGVDHSGITAYEVNLSCPNLDHRLGIVGATPAGVDSVMSRLRPLTDRPLIAKLTPATASIAETAQAAERAGADAVTVCNSFPAMGIDVHSRCPVLGNVTGGLSGPAVKPLALKLVYDAASAIDIPVIGCGGIGSVDDVLAFLIAGATSVQIGTALFARPTAINEIVAALPAALQKCGARTSDDLIGTLRRR
ncbi:dihydroorotate dehydrogenase [Pseudoclavibacter sp. CFCC 11306]|uniref:dihydroorotate dehydrogenase n=1 Tax=Pseudoclavibacter sp. CFCC 11306 TaxID=1564493 RepID=UPI001301359E|nr:dihydroorotate dehydrogenase [Pseudoclavibacter sp. CFCC 11306]KAB1657677.1 dihydroorotate dehydrogenase [Pseudoclavibacter sp. CFCC 11306]